MQPHLGNPDRRRFRRGSAGSPHRTDLVTMIVGTYREMPGLSLSFYQAARLFGLPLETTHIVLRDLVHGGLLERNASGQYVRGARAGDAARARATGDDTIDDMGRTA